MNLENVCKKVCVEEIVENWRYYICKIASSYPQRPAGS